MIHQLAEISQIVLAGVGILALIGSGFVAYFGYRQVKASTIFELLRIIEAPNLRESRRIVMLEIPALQNNNWWNDDRRLETAAADVCAAFDILGTLTGYGHKGSQLPGRYGKFFEEAWAPSIVKTHNALRGYLDHRRQTQPNAYEAYSELAKSARKWL